MHWRKVLKLKKIKKKEMSKLFIWNKIKGILPSLLQQEVSQMVEVEDEYFHSTHPIERIFKTDRGSINKYSTHVYKNGNKLEIQRSFFSGTVTESLDLDNKNLTVETFGSFPSPKWLQVLLSFANETEIIISSKKLDSLKSRRLQTNHQLFYFTNWCMGFNSSTQLKSIQYMGTFEAIEKIKEHYRLFTSMRKFIKKHTIEELMELGKLHQDIHLINQHILT